MYTQQSVRALWDHPERAREDEAFERSRAPVRPGEIEVFVMEDENVDRILAGRPPTQSAASSGPATMNARPKATSASSRASGSGANRSDPPGSRNRSGRDSPTCPRPPSLTVPIPAPVQVLVRKQPENTAPPDPDEVIVLKDDDEPLGGSGNSKSNGSGKKNRVYTPGEKAALDEYRKQLHSACRQIQYSLEFDDFKAYWRNIPNLRESANTDDHTAYLRDHVLKEQPNSYACAGNLLTAKAFSKKLHRDCRDQAKIEKADKMLQNKALPGVPDDLPKEDGQRVKLTARYVM